MNVDAWQKVEEVNGWFNDEYFTIIIIQTSTRSIVFNKEKKRRALMTTWD